MLRSPVAKPYCLTLLVYHLRETGVKPLFSFLNLFLGWRVVAVDVTRWAIREI